MAISWNLPALANKIAHDVPFINTLLTALCKWAPETASTTGLPTGAKRMTTASGGVQLQNFNGTAWESSGKLVHDVESVDGFDALDGDPNAPSAVLDNYKNKIPVRDSNGKIPGDLTGNAATASSAVTLSQKLPISLGGTNATTAADARANLGTNDAGNITAGVLALARGGTARTDGFSQDVVFPLTGSSFTSAKAVGQLGLTLPVKSAVDCDSLVQMGRYNCTGGTLNLHYPFAGQQLVEVTGDSACLVQTSRTRDNKQVWQRVSTNNGASWTGWTPVSYVANASLYIYISDSGSDANTGTDNAHPVATVARAMQIAQGMRDYGMVFLCFGRGEWGNVTINGAEIPAQEIVIANYSNSAVTAKADYDSLESGTGTNLINQPPSFSNLNLRNGYFSTRNIRPIKLNLYSATLAATKWMNVSRITATQSYVNISSGFTCSYHSDVGTSAFVELSGSIFRLGNCAYQFATTTNDVPTNGVFIQTYDSADIYVHGSATFSGTFSGKKYAFTSGTCVRLGKAPGSWPGSQAGTGEYSQNGSATNAWRVENTPPGTSWVAGATRGKALVNSSASSFGAVFNAPTKSYRVGLGTYPGSNDLVYLYSVTNANVNAGTNTVAKQLLWNASNGDLTATRFVGPLEGNAKTATKATQDGSGNVITSTYLPKSGGTVTGTLILSRTTDLSGTANKKPALIVGGTDTQAHIEFDNNEIQAKANGTSVGPLYINGDGGAVYAEGKRVVKGTGGSATKPIYVDGNGNVVASGSNVGNANQPVYLKSGVITACNNFSTAVSEKTMVPNWSARANRSANTNYTAGSNGYAMIRGDDGSWRNPRITINGVEYSEQFWSYTSHQCKHDVFPIAKGDKYRSTQAFYWIPAK